jgi:hypothetical protein
MDNANDLAGGSEEWLRRLAVGRSRVIVPEDIALALTAAGLAERSAWGVLTPTADGKAYLDLRGLRYVAARRSRT